MNPKQMQPVPFSPVDIQSSEWQAWFQGVVAASKPQGGTTAQRPADPQIYQQYFDETLGLPIWCETVTPAVTWCDAAGNSV